MTTALALTVAACGTAIAAEPRASLADLEDEVMCLECGTALNLSHAPVAERERAFIRREIARGRTKAQIKDALVDRFGPAVLALPEEKGFGLAAYLVPLLVALLATVGVCAAARHRRHPPADAFARHSPDAEDEQRLERELAAHDCGPACPGPRRR